MFIPLRARKGRSLHHHLKPERHLLVKAVLSVCFGLSCMVAVQIPLIQLLSGFTARPVAFAIAFVLSGAVDFHLNYFITHGKKGLSLDHFRNVDWAHYKLSAGRQAMATGFCSFINSAAQWVLIGIGLLGHQWLIVFVANLVSGIANQLFKLFVVYARKSGRHARREENN